MFGSGNPTDLDFLWLTLTLVIENKNMIKSDATHKIWSRLANWLQRHSSVDDDGQLVYYKLPLWAFGSGELKKLFDFIPFFSWFYTYI